MSETLRWQTSMLLDKLDYLVEGAEMLDIRIEEVLAAMGEAHKLDLLQTIPDVSKVAAMTILLELGVDVSDFRSGQSLTRWAGMCPGNNESAGKRKSGKAMHGNKHLKRILCEVANAAVRTDSVFKKKYGVIKVRLGRKKAVMATGHKRSRGWSTAC
jgi:transposase